MLLTIPLLSFLLTTLIPPATTSTNPPDPSYLFSNPPSTHPLHHHIPTRHDSAILARRIYHLSSIATFSTVFPPSPNNHPQQQQQDQQPLLTSPPSSVSGAPIGLMDYYAACAPQPAQPLLLAINIATTIRNAHAGSNVSLHLRWHPPSPPSTPSSPSFEKNKDEDDDDDDPFAHLPANLPRFSLNGYLAPIPASELATPEWKDTEECFYNAHPEARMWAPGQGVHESYWARLVPEGGVYWVGGFGDRAFIGWIGREEWEGVRRGEWEEGRLVGEEG